MMTNVLISVEIRRYMHTFTEDRLGLKDFPHANSKLMIMTMTPKVAQTYAGSLVREDQLVAGSASLM